MEYIRHIYFSFCAAITFFVFSMSHFLYSQSLLCGNIQYAKNSTAEDVGVYYCGKRISTHKNTIGVHKITYDVPKGSDQNIFYLLIYPKAPDHTLKDALEQDSIQNTVGFLKINPEIPYLFYKLTLTSHEQDSVVTYKWEIAQEPLSESGQIPETTIIIIHLPSRIKAVSGGNQLELPTIFVDTVQEQKNDDMDIVPLTDLDEELIKLQLSVLDLNALHAPVSKKIKVDKHRLLIMDTIA